MCSVSDKFMARVCEKDLGVHVRFGEFKVSMARKGLDISRRGDRCSAEGETL